VELEHLRIGAGEPLVLVHGIGHHLGGWAPVVDALAARHEVWAVSLPGFGESPGVTAAPTVGALAGAVAEFMTQRGQESFHVAGNSLGGGVALELARAGRARSVCAIAPVGFWSAPERAYLHASLVVTRASAVALAPVAGRVARRPRLRRAVALQMNARGERWTPAQFASSVRALAHAPGFHATRRAALADRFADGEAVSCPVTVAWPEHDRLLLTRPQSRRARRALPTATHVILRGCGHVPMADDPEQVARVILTAARR
jgi:pimeloyl-ACP methyl ester carboxylesterase